MRCEKFLELVEVYFDGELDELERARVAEHLEACATCAGALRKLEREQRLYLRYECDAEPAPAFWQNVMARAAREGAAQTGSTPLRDRLRALLESFSAPRFSPSLTALVVLIAVAITALVMTGVNRKEKATDVNVSRLNNESTASSTPDALAVRSASTGAPEGEAVDEKEGDGATVGGQQSPQVKDGPKDRAVLVAKREEIRRRREAVSNHEPTPDKLVREAEQKYVAAIAILSRDVNRRRPQLDQETAAQFEKALAAIDRTIENTRRVARKHPGDPIAAQYMLTAYARKVDVLREIVGY
ncbi:MAG TPA: zf-HC2 domain-containing protein [Pyrinomonadaceae bacterium]